MWRSLAKRLTLLAFLGVLTSIVVSWAIALRTDLRGAPRLPQIGASSRYYNLRANQAWIFNDETLIGAIQMSCAPAGQLTPAETVDEAEIPSWSILRSTRIATSANYIEQGFGWPMLAHYQRFEGDFNSNVPWKCSMGLRVQPALKSLGPGAALPCGIIPIGMAVNAGIYGWFWFALLSFPMLIRTVLRRRRGACQACGYDLRATPGACPECGARSR